jgi:hypothetical protein
MTKENKKPADKPNKEPKPAPKGLPVQVRGKRHPLQNFLPGGRQ